VSCLFIIPLLPGGWVGYTVLHLSVLPSVQDIFRGIFGPKLHIGMPYDIVGRVFGPVRFLLPVCRLSWFLYTLNICAHFSSHFSQQLLMTQIWYLVKKFHIGTPYRGKRFWTHQIPTSCLPTLLIFIHIEHICSFFVAFFSTTIDGRNLIFGHKLHIGIPYRGKRFFDPSDSYFLFAEEQRYHTWALAHSSFCFMCIYRCHVCSFYLYL
jgi:hypothetical protein